MSWARSSRASPARSWASAAPSCSGARPRLRSPGCGHGCFPRYGVSTTSTRSSDPNRPDRVTSGSHPVFLDPRPHDGREVLEMLARPFTDQRARDRHGGAVTVDHHRASAHATTELAPVGL